MLGPTLAAQAYASFPSPSSAPFCPVSLIRTGPKDRADHICDRRFVEPRTGPKRPAQTRRLFMRGTVLYGPRDFRFEDREAPRVEKPTDAIIRIAATCMCGLTQ